MVTASSASTHSVASWSQAFRRVGWIRRAGIPLYRGYRSLSASGRYEPIIINSIPKAGTHLFSSLLTEIPGLAYSGRVFVHDQYGVRSAFEGDLPQSSDYARFERNLNALRAGTYANCHLYYDAPTVSAIGGKSSIFVIRDPRAIVVSMLKYVQDFKRHHLHDFLIGSFSDDESRLVALIEGWEPSRRLRGMRSLAVRCNAFMGWQAVLPTFRYEDFVAPTDPEALDESLARFFSSVGVGELDASIRSRVAAAAIGNPWSATFSSGSADSWRSRFTPAVQRAYDNSCGELHRMMGYPD